MSVGRAQRLPRLVGAIGLSILPGCLTAPPPPEGLSTHPLDVSAAQVAEQNPPPPRPVAEPPKANVPLPERLKVPPELPGANAPPLQLPPSDPNNRTAFERALAELFPAPPALPNDPVPSDGPVVTLSELQQQLLANHPALRQAVADVDAARGAAVQAGLPPNPTIGFEADTIGSGGTAGQQGGKIEQVIKTAGKLRLAQKAALVDVLTSQVTLRKTQFDLMAQVRAAYFAVIVAEEQVRVTFLVSQLLDEVYRVEIDRLKGGQTAVYEPAQIRAQAVQARAALIQARNRYASAWRQLAAAVGRPDMAPSRLAGRATMPLPEFPYEAIRDRMLAVHTDLRNAENSVARARLQLQIAEVTPIPDVNLKLVVQKDYSVAPFATTANVEIGVPVPVWDRNQGGIQQAQGQLGRAINEAQRVRLDLLSRLADASERYSSNRQVVSMYQEQVLPDQVRSYQRILLRSQLEPDKIQFIDIYNAQQQLATFLTTYLNALEGQWKAVVDLAALAQVDDLYPPAVVEPKK